MKTIRHTIDMKAAQQPEKVFMIAPEPGLSLTYAQLREDSIELGKQLLKKGFNKGDKISSMLSNGYQTTKIFLGAMYSGFVIAPLNLLAQPSYLEYVADHSDTKLVFFTEEQRDRLEKACGAVSRKIELMEIDKDSPWIFPKDGDLAALDLPEVGEEDDALLLYTSGTTGFPKGAVLSHKNMVSGGLYTSLAHDLKPEDRALCSLPLYHINGEVVTAVSPLVSGGSVVMPHKFSTSDFWELISKYRCTWFSVVPTIISYLTNATDIEGKGYHLDQLRFGRSASARSLRPFRKPLKKSSRSVLWKRWD